MKLLLATLPLALVLTASACGGRDPVAADADNVAGLNEAVAAANETVAEAHQIAENRGGPVLNEADDAGSEQPSPPGTPEASMIPGQYRGRWGMVPNDCDQSRSDTKGAITIGERSIVFYESTAMLKERRPAIATSFAGLFAFTGEGQSWQKVQTLTRTGDRLVRAEDGGRFTYTRCA